MTQEYGLDELQQSTYSLEHYRDNPQDAKQVIAGIYTIYIDKIIEKQKYGLFWFFSTKEFISSGSYGLRSATTFLQELDDCPLSLSDITICLLKKGSWGNYSRILTLLCLDVICNQVDLSAVKNNFRKHLNEPNVQLPGLQFSTPVPGECFSSLSRLEGMNKYAQKHSQKLQSDNFAQQVKVLYSYALVQERDTNRMALAIAEAPDVL